jgi:choice-of-anchor A domain-containing protein
MHKSLSLVIAAAAASSLFGVVSGARASSVELLNYNLVVTNNMTAGSHISGQSVVNNLTTSNLSEFGQNVSSGDALDAAGTVSGSFKVWSGVFHHDQSISNASVNYLNGASQSQDSVASTLLSQLSSSMTSLSSGLAGLSTTTGTSASISNNSLNFNYTGSSTGEVVFTVAASQFSQAGSISFSLGTATSEVINVTGTGSYTSSANFTGSINSTPSSLIWNFASAAAFTTSTTWEGTVLGPGLSLTTGNNVDGSVYVKNFSQGGEVHGDYFSGAVPAHAPGVAVPLPSPLTAGTGLLVALGGLRLVRSRRA